VLGETDGRVVNQNIYALPASLDLLYHFLYAILIAHSGVYKHGLAPFGRDRIFCFLAGGGVVLSNHNSVSPLSEVLGNPKSNTSAGTGGAYLDIGGSKSGICK